LEGKIAALIPLEAVVAGKADQDTKQVEERIKRNELLARDLEAQVRLIQARKDLEKIQNLRKQELTER
jgi:hypothetical protein